MTFRLHLGLFVLLALFFTGCSPKTTGGGSPDSPVEDNDDSPTVVTDDGDTDNPTANNDDKFIVASEATNVPVFVGYTQKNPRTADRSPITKPVRISSLAEYELTFGPAAGREGPFYLHPSLRLFFANGGSSCYVYSVGIYRDVVEPSAIRSAFAAGGVVERQEDITLISVPDAVKLSPEDTYPVYQEVLAHCARTANRFAILDLHHPTREKDVEATVNEFRGAMGNEHLKYGSAYFPWVVSGSDTLPATGAITGIYAMNDDQNGVWKAVANLPVKGIDGLSIAITNEQQGDLNAPQDGKSISALRSFEGRGNLVWGARTLNGNSADWRYSNVVRTEMMISASIKTMLRRLAFEPNTKSTWSKTKAGIEIWLESLWQQGALAGATPADSYSVGVGLGETMTPTDILDGIMIISVKVALGRPQEFFELTYAQPLSDQ